MYVDEVVFFCGIVSKVFMMVEDGQVVDEMNVVGLSLNFYFCSLSNGFNGI